jgi:hypothetical protein
MGARKLKPVRVRKKLSSAPRPAHRPRSKQNNAMALWLDATPLTVAEVAARLKVGKEYLYNLRVGARRAGRDLAVAIEQLSDGMVPVESWAR